jgi:hypothetical protein
MKLQHHLSAKPRQELCELGRFLNQRDQKYNKQSMLLTVRCSHSHPTQTRDADHVFRL